MFAYCNKYTYCRICQEMTFFSALKFKRKVVGILRGSEVLGCKLRHVADEDGHFGFHHPLHILLR